MNSIKNSKSRFTAIFAIEMALVVAVGGFAIFFGNGHGDNLVSKSVPVVKAAIAADGDTTGDVDDLGEVQKGDIIDYWLEATYVGFEDEPSGLITYTDQLPDHVKLVTGTHTVAGVETDCTPSITNSANPQVTWADPQNPYTYDEVTRTFTAQVSNVPPSDGTTDSNVVKIHIYAEVLDDATSLNVESVYYTNYVKITCSGATTISNKVQFHSGNLSDQTYTVKYRFKDSSVVPEGVKAPTDDTTYSKGAEMTIQPNMEALGYTFSGWSLVTTGLDSSAYEWNKDSHTFKLNKGTTSVTEVTFEGEWSAQDKIDVTYTWQGKVSDLESDDSPDDKPVVGEPEASQEFEGAALRFPDYPATAEKRADASYKAEADSYADLYDLYDFLGWKAFVTDVDGASAEQVLTTAEKAGNEFVPKAASGKKVKSVNIVGYWVRHQFTVTFTAETGEAPAGWTAPAALKSKWGVEFSVNDQVVDGYRFNGWRMKPDLEEIDSTTVDARSARRYIMTSSDVTAYASFTKTYAVSVVSGTASTSDVSEAKEIQAAEGEVVTVKPLQGMENVRFTEWDSTVATTANNWINQTDGSATFVMPANDVDVTGKYVIDIYFVVTNGTWSDDTTDSIMKRYSVVQQADDTWTGTMPADDIPTGMKVDGSHQANSGKWGDGTTAEQLPSTYAGANKLKADNAGKATHLTTFTYTFTDPLPSITITYKVNDAAYGNVKINGTTGNGSAQVTEDNIDPVGSDDQVKGAVAISNTGYTFKSWVRNNDPGPYSLDASFVPGKVVYSENDDGFFEAATYTANFEPNSYTVKFNGNGATSGTMDDLSLKVGTRSALTANAFVKDGFKFGGWTTNADYTGDYYANEEDVLNLATDDGAVVNLYAKWVENRGEVVPVDPTDPTAGSLTGYANNIRIPLSQAEQLAGKTDSSTLSTLTNLSAAYFTFTKADTRTELVDVASVELNNIKAAVGTYDVTLKSAAKSGKTASVKFAVVVYNETSGDTDTDPTIKIAANDFTVSVDEVKSGKLNDGSDAGAKAELIRLSNAYAWNALTRDEIEVSSVTSAIAVDAAGVGVKGVYDVTFAAQSADATKKAEVTVAATVTDYADEKADMRITAHDFAVAASNVANMSDADFVEAANARATSTVDGSALGVSIDRTTEAKTNVKAARGKYVMTFYTESAEGLKDGPEVTVEVLVTDKIIDDGDSNHVIYANDFSVGATFVPQLDDAKVIKLANAGAYDKATGADLTLSVDYHVIEAKRGTYFPVAFSTDKVNLNVACVVTDESTEPGGDDATYDLSANNFTISVDEATDILAMSEANKNKELIDRAFARAVLIETGEYVDFTTIDSSRLQAKDGKYNITFAVDADHSITVVCTVGGTIEPSGPDASSKLGISASGFKIGLEQATDLKIDRPEGNDALIELASARAWKISDNSSVQISEIVNNIELQRGSYDVTFKAVLYDYAEDGTATEVDTKEVTVLATITDKQVDPNPEPSPGPDPDKPTPKPDPDDPNFVNVEAFANDFVVSVEDVTDNNLGDGNAALDKLIELGNVSARTITEHVAVDIVSAVSTIQPAKGTYSVTYTSDEIDGKSVDITSKVRVTDEGEGGGESGGGDDAKSAERILANNFALSKAEADAIARGEVYTDSKIDRAYAAAALNAGQKELVRLSNAFAYRVADGYQLDITRVDFDYTGEFGASTATFATENGTSLSVVATVTSESAENAENGERIVANDIEYTFEEAEELLAKANDEIATQLANDANAHATSTVDGSNVDVVNAEWNIQAAEGVYDVTFSTEKGTSVTVKAAVGEKPLDPSALAALSKTGDNFWKYALLAILIVLISSGVVYALRKRRA